MADISVSKALFDRMSEDSKKEIRSVYGDNLDKWYEDYWRHRESSILERSKKLAEYGFDVKGMTLEILRIVKERTGK